MLRYLWLCLVLGCLALPVWGQFAPYSGEGISDSRAGSEPQMLVQRGLNDGIEERLLLLEQVYLSRLDGAELSRAMLITQELRALIGARLGSTDGQLYQGYGRRPRVMHSQDFAEFKTSVRKAIFADDALRIVKYAADENYFSATQIVEIIKLRMFPDEQLKMLEYMYPSCLDARNKYQILDAFYFDDDRQKAEKIINK